MATVVRTKNYLSIKYPILMKHLAFLIVLLFSTSAIHAQMAYSAESDSLALKNSPKDIALALPMLGNVRIPKATYFFQQLSIPFQVDYSTIDWKEKDWDIEIVCVTDSIYDGQEDTLAIDRQF